MKEAVKASAASPVQIQLKVQPSAQTDPTQTQPIPDAPVVVPSAVMARNLKLRPNPIYPPKAKSDRVQGAVVLNVVIAKTGEVKYCAVASGPEVFVDSAIEAVKHWTYNPYLVNGKPVEVKTTITVNYNFGDPASVGVTGPVHISVSPAPVREAPVPVPSSEMARNVVWRPDPIYPADAKAAHVQGAVILRAIISKTGTVKQLEIVSGPDLLQPSALEAVKKWTYKPYLVNGEPVEVETQITVHYTFGLDGMLQRLIDKQLRQHQELISVTNA